MNDRKGKIGVLIEDHFDPTEYREFNDYFPKHGYEVEYISHLWDQPQLRFSSNPENDTIEYHVTVTREVNKVDPADYKGIILIGAYAMDSYPASCATRRTVRVSWGSLATSV